MIVEFTEDELEDLKYFITEEQSMEYVSQRYQHLYNLIQKMDRASLEVN